MRSALPVHGLGAVLAGGRSTRFGADKARVPLAGATLLERAVATLCAVFDDVVVLSSDPAHVLDGVERVPDLRDGFGPLAAIEAALGVAHRRGFDGVFILACDLPLVEPEQIRTLLDGLGQTQAVAPAREGPPGFEPLCAFYRTSCLAPAGALLDSGRRGAHALLERVQGHTIPMPSGRFLNVNTTAELVAAEASLRSPRT